jgi:hypothetical protein
VTALSNRLSNIARERRNRAKGAENHNPRVGGSSPSSGIPATACDPRPRAKNRRFVSGRLDRNEPLRTGRPAAEVSNEPA